MNQSFTSFADFRRRYPIRPNDAGALLGSGSYGRVFKVEDQLETEWVAIKISEFKGNDTKSLKAEVELAQGVPRQGNIARYDACYRLETDTSVSDFAIMKYYPDGNLADLLQRVTLTPSQIYDITQGILLGLQHLHRHRIVHRDFKPANILISRDNAGRYIPKIADFGLSKLVTSDELDNSDFDLSDGRGTPSYKAPEQIEGSRVSFNLDLWAFGVILYEIMTGEKPFRADRRSNSEQSARREIEKKIISVELPTRINQVAEPYATMIRRCLIRDIHERVRKETELLDLLDRIPQLLNEASVFVNDEQYTEALAQFEQVLAKRENQAEAQQGADQCRAALERQRINNLRSEAAVLIEQQQFDEAKVRYEQVLQLDPTDAAAAHELAVCMERLRPRRVTLEPELTDVYQEERTDVYEAPTARVTVKKESQRTVLTEPVAVETATVSKVLPDRLPTTPATRLPVGGHPARSFPWWSAVPAAVVVGGLVWYLNGRDPVTPAISSARESTEQQAKIGLTTIPDGSVTKDLGATVPMPTLGSLSSEARAVLTKRIDVALEKARRAYLQKDYEGAVMLTNSALQLDPTRKDVAALRTAAVKEIQKKATGTEPEASATTPVTESPKAVDPAPETKAPEPAEDAKEKSLNEKREQQSTYDQLIEEGVKAIANGNNKPKAIALFNKAQALAKEHELSNDRADAAYVSYMNKANKIFDNEEYEGAKDWYEVARALKNTDEVRRRIKQCLNQ